MKKAVISILVCLMLVLSFAMISCKKPTPPEPENPEIGYSGEPSYKEDGETQGAAAAKSYVASRSDDRTELYKAYTAAGTLIGNYKSLANAANAAIDKDVADKTFGAYVLKNGAPTKMFVNYQGYDKKDNEETFWVYDNGLSLDSYWCWDDVSTLDDVRDTKKTMMGTKGFGTKAAQPYQSFSSYGKGGSVIDNAFSPWKFTRPTDAAVYTYSKIYSGMTKLEYELDLSDVKIYPAHTEGSEAGTVYAFMGFYIWQDYYVINMGMACDTKTGNWYPYSGTARDDSSSDTVYTEDGCIMTSTWNSDGYFVPDNNKVVLSAQTKRLEDNFGDFQVVDVAFDVKGGATYSRRLTDANLNNWFSSANLSMENSFVFLAGLDVIAPVTAQPLTANIDQFNGAAFLNLKVTSARAYVPTEEELSDLWYGKKPTATRGEWHDMLWSNTSGEGQVFEHAVTYNNHATTYTKGDGVDTFSFSFNKYTELAAATAPALSTKAGQYQAKIDLVDAQTVETIGNFIADMNTIEGWWVDGTRDATGRTIHEKYYNVLDFAGYLRAKIVMDEWATLTPEGQAIYDTFMEIPALDRNYVLVGWKNTGVPAAGYLYNDYEAIKARLAEFSALDEAEQEKVVVRIGLTRFENWFNFVEMLSAAEDHANFSDAGFMTYKSTDAATGSETTTKDLSITPATAFAQMVTELIGIKTVKALDKPDTYSDHVFQKVARFVVCYDYLTKLELIDASMPNFFHSAFMWYNGETIGADYFESAMALGNIVRIGSYWQKNTAADTIANEITAAQAALLTKYFANGFVYKNGMFSYNIKEFYANPTNKFGYLETSHRGKILFDYFKTSGSTYTTVLESYNKVVSVLSDHGYTMEPGAIAAVGNKWRVTATSVTPKAVLSLADTLSSGGRTFFEQWVYFGDITAYGDVKGIIDGDGTDFVQGYLYNMAYEVHRLDLDNIWTALGSEDKAKIAAFYGKTEIQMAAMVAAWSGFLSDMDTLLADSTYTDDITTYSLYDMTTVASGTALVDKTAAELLKDIAVWGYKIKAGGIWEGTASKVMDAGNSWFQSVYIVNAVNLYEEAGLDLPAAISQMLTSIDYELFEDAYNSLYFMASLGKKIAEDPTTYADVNGVTVDELALLNIYWVNSYPISAKIIWNWENAGGGKFETYMSARVAKVVLIANGANEKLMKEYIALIAKMLEDSGYSIKANGWGVTVDTIIQITIPAAVKEFNKMFDKIPANVNTTFTTATNKVIKWMSGDGSELATGYVYNTARNAQSVLDAWNDLEEEEQEFVADLNSVTVEQMDDLITTRIGTWTALWAEWDDLEEDAAYTAEDTYSLYIGNMSYVSTYSPDNTAYTARQLLGEVYKYAYSIKNGGSWEGSNPISHVDQTWFPSLQLAFALEKFENLGFELPANLQAVVDEISGKTAGDAGFIASVRAFIVTVQIAGKITAGGLTDLAELDAADIELLNKYWASGFKLSESGDFFVHWGLGKFMNWATARIKALVKLSGGDDTNGITPYYDTICGFLSNTTNNYVIKTTDGNWGVTAATIAVPEPVGP